MSQTLGKIEEADKLRPAPEEQLRLFRNLMRSLTHDAGKALAELEMWCKDANQLERCRLVQHYLSYIKRLCEGKA